jgi:hypothetical protein
VQKEFHIIIFQQKVSATTNKFINRHHAEYLCSEVEERSDGLIDGAQWTTFKDD